MAMMSRGEDQCAHCVEVVTDRPWTVGGSNDVFDGDEGMMMMMMMMMMVVVVVMMTAMEYCVVEDMRRCRPVKVVLVVVVWSSPR